MGFAVFLFPLNQEFKNNRFISSLKIYYTNDGIHFSEVVKV